MRFEGIIISLKYFSVYESLLRIIDCLENGTTEGVLLSSAVQLEP